MTKLWQIALGLAAGVGLILSSKGTPPARAEETTSVIRVGVVKSLFRDMSDAAIKVLSRPLISLMETQTGLTADWQTGSNAFVLSKLLMDGKVQLGIYHGFEYAWIRERNPDLKPLMIALGQQSQMRAYLVVARDSGIHSCADLKGKVVSVPQFSRAHCHLFLERRCCGKCNNPKEFFARISTPSDVTDALNDVATGRVQAAVVEKPALDDFQRYYARRSEQLTVLVESEAFPAGVIVYRASRADEKLLARFREGMLGAHQTVRGKELLNLCRLAGFAAVPDDYEMQLKVILKAYPAPEK